jgi:uncharacterized membrane protein YvbJ
MKNCPNCSHQNPDDAKFCETCGTALSLNTPQPSLTNTPTNAVMWDGTKIGLAVLSFIIPLVGIILGISYMNNTQPEKKAVGKTYLFLGIGGIALGCVCAMLGGLSEY